MGEGRGLPGLLRGAADYMKYDEYLAAGYPIGSGVVEGACRHLVKDRMEQTGMRWRIAGAQADSQSASHLRQRRLGNVPR